MSELSLSHGLAFEDLYCRDKLARLDAIFVARLEAVAPPLARRLADGRADPAGLGARQRSDLLVELAPVLEDFLGELFGVAGELAAQRGEHERLAPIAACKRDFIRRRAARAFAPGELEAEDGEALQRRVEALLGAPLEELAFARAAMAWLRDEEAHGEALEHATRFAAWAVLTPAGRARWRKSPLFSLPQKIDPARLVAAREVEVEGVAMLAARPERRRRREGFALTDAGMDGPRALAQASYCIFCQRQGKDSCRHGLKEKQGGFARSPGGVALAGCPLDQKIGEMNLLKARGRSLAALAVAMVDNPLCAATGHRICNDCMKACIYQRQEPVDIPQIETRVLKDVLALPWGVEIYSLLSRWNPLHLERPLPRPATGRRVLVVGLGPAGFTLAHHLLNDGHAVVAIDGLKIEPLAAELSGRDERGRGRPFRPVRDMAALAEPLDKRAMAGFGGVAEYGITARWDKNFLKLVRLQLERRARFRMYGGVRFGGTLSIAGAFAAGFDHIALCAGAGRPTAIAMPGALTRGVRMASDFLMALQLTGAGRDDAIANLQLRLPVVAIGGGLTAIDAATEARAYYPVQVERFLRRYETLASERGEAAARAGWNDEESEIGDLFLAHGRAIRAERRAAEAAGRQPDIDALIDRWGGVTVAYRRELAAAPSYRLNHEEVALALEEGIRIAPGLTPVAVETDRHGHAQAVRFRDEAGHMRSLAAGAVLVAAGTQPNTVLAREEEELALDGRYFQAIDPAGKPVMPEASAKPARTHVLAHLAPDGRAVSFHGDLHPGFAGNVVKAMGGAKRAAPVVSTLMARLERRAGEGESAFFARLDDLLLARVAAVRQLAPAIVEVEIEAPAAAAAFQPGQFYRLQNLESCAPRAGDGTVLAMEPLAMTGAAISGDRRRIAIVGLQMGGSSDLMERLRPGEPVVLMGPTGTASTIPEGETVLLVGGGLGNAVLFSIGQAMRRAGCRVLYVAGYRRIADRYKADEIEAAADVVLWACEQAPGFRPARAQDRAYVGHVVAALLAFQAEEAGGVGIALGEVDRIVCIGSQPMMAAVKAARHGPLRAHLKPGHIAIASINSPMQCMMKEICAQCLQPRIDPQSGAELAPVFSCFAQDQEMDGVDFDALGQRLAQNGVQEKLTRLWVARSLAGLRPDGGGG